MRLATPPATPNLPTPMDPHLTIAVGLGMPSGFEWVVIMVIGLLLFGKNLPSVMRGLGGSVKEFKKGMEEGATPSAPPAPPALPPPSAAPEGTVSRTPITQQPGAPTQPPQSPPPAAH